MATVTHLLDKPFPYGQDSAARWAVAGRGKVVLFVHGSGGDSVDTWGDFSFALPALPAAADYDLIFYGYDALHTRPRLSAVQLRGLLHDLFTDPRAVVNRHLPPAAQRDAAFAYTDVLIAAHGLGAVVARQALAEDWYDGGSFAGRVRLALFAPADGGLELSALARLIGAPLTLLSPTADALAERLPALRDVQPGSDLLTRLEAATREAAAAENGGHMSARRVVLAEQDIVVHPTRFAADPGAIVIAEADHGSVCRPGPASAEALEIVAALL